MIAIYEPGKNEKDEDKHKFWDELNVTTEDAKETIYVAGDFKCRVGKKITQTNHLKEIMEKTWEVTMQKECQITKSLAK